ncbi:hypothetical protein YC2023_059800 [Brassica napus]
MVTDDTWVEIMNNKWNRGIVEKKLEISLKRCDQRPIKVRFFTDKSKAQEVTKELYKRYATLKTQEELLEWNGENAKDNAKIIHASERCAAWSKSFSKRCFLLLRVQGGQCQPGSDLSIFSSSMGDGEEGMLRTHPGGVFVHPYGAEKSLRDTIDELGKNHGDKKDKKFRIWTDQVLATDATPRTWIVKLNKWEQTGN